MPTPTLARLADEGVRLDQAYSQQVCTPSRAALLTGKYPFHIGRQKRALKPLQPTGLQLNLTTLPQELKKLGYNTHIVGKWHLGYCAWEYTPTRRGFDSFLGFYLGSENHFSHDRDYKTKPDDPPAFYDFRENEAVAKQDYKGVYSTTVFKRRAKDIIADAAEERALNVYDNYKPFFIYLSFQATHAPLQARAEMLAKIPQTNNPARDIYKAMVLDMDLAMAGIVKTLKDKDLYNDTIIVFTSDNGGAISHGASNYPLRGTKGTLFEGGTKAPTFIHAPHILKHSRVVSNNLVHITDWMPTILSMAGYAGNPSNDLSLDGIDQWKAINDHVSVRDEMVYNLKVGPISGAVRIGPHKIIFGKKFNKQGWYDTDNTALQCETFKKDKKEKRKQKKKEAGQDEKRKGKKMNTSSKELEKKRSKNLKRKQKVENRKTKRNNKIEYHHNKIAKKQEKNAKQIKMRRKRKQEKKDREREKERFKKMKSKRLKEKQKREDKYKMDNKEFIPKKSKLKNKISYETYKKFDEGKKKKEKIRKTDKKDKAKEKIRKKDKKDKVKYQQKIDKELKKQEKRLANVISRAEQKKEKKLTKIWKDWLPLPSLEMQDMMRLRMDDCNWEEFEDSGHSQSLNLIPRSDLQAGGMVQLINPILNPYNISAEDEDSEFDLNTVETHIEDELNIEELFDQVDIALYNVIDDPSEKNDLRFELPKIFTQLRARAIYHLKQVVPADFPPQDYSGHPSHFQGFFSPGWCQPKYL